MLMLFITGCTVEIGYRYYEYEDLDGNKGKAIDCWKPYGNMICELEDNTQIKVKKYKGIN